MLQTMLTAPRKVHLGASSSPYKQHTGTHRFKLINIFTRKESDLSQWWCWEHPYSRRGGEAGLHFKCIALPFTATFQFIKCFLQTLLMLFLPHRVPLQKANSPNHHKYKGEKKNPTKMCILLQSFQTLQLSFTGGQNSLEARSQPR